MEGKELKKRRNLMIAVLMMAVLTACGSDGGTSQKEPIRQEIKNNTEENQEDILTDEMETEEALYQTVEEFAYVTYIHIRPHSYNGYRIPCQARTASI